MEDLAKEIFRPEREFRDSIEKILVDILVSKLNKSGSGIAAKTAKNVNSNNKSTNKGREP